MYVSLCTYEAEHQFPHRQKIEREMVFRQSVRGAKWILCGNAKIHKFTPFVALYWMQALPHAIFISSNLQCPALCVCASVWFFFHMKIEWSASPKKTTKMVGIIIFGILYWNGSGKFALTYSSLDILVLCVFTVSGFNIEYQTVSTTISKLLIHTANNIHTWKTFQFLLWFRA